MELGLSDRSVEPTAAEVLSHAKETLSEFKSFVKEAFPRASSIYEGAKNLYEEIRAHWARDEGLVHKGEWSADQFDQDLKQVTDQQQATWEKLLAAAKQESELVKLAYAKVKEAEKTVLHARGEGSHVAWMGLPTSDQQEVRKVYNHQLREQFHDAKMEMDSLIGFPDGVLQKVDMILKRANKETEHLSQQLHKHPRGGILSHIPFIK